MQQQMKLSLSNQPILYYLRPIYRKNRQWIMATRRNKKHP